MAGSFVQNPRFGINKPKMGLVAKRGRKRSNLVSTLGDIAIGVATNVVDTSLKNASKPQTTLNVEFKRSANNGKSKKKDSSSNNSDGFGPYKPSPTNQVKWNSGIKSRVYQRYIIPGDNEESPIFINNGSILSRQNPALLDDKVRAFLDTHYNRVSFMVAKVKGPNVSRNLTKDGYYDYLFDLLDAFQPYFVLKSILAYGENKHPFTNYGITKIRERINFKYLSQLQILEDNLLNQNFPKELLEFLRYLYSNYKASDCPNSAIIRLSFNRLLYTGGDGSVITDSLEDDILVRVNDALSQPIMSWKGELHKNPEVQIKVRTQTRDILMSCFPGNEISSISQLCMGVEPMYDKTFLSFWHNSPITWIDIFDIKNISVSHSRTIASPSEDQPFEVCCDSDLLDGYIFGLMNFNYNGKFGPGLWTPLRNFDKLDDLTNHTSLLRMETSILVGNIPKEMASSVGILYVPRINTNSKDSGKIKLARYHTLGTDFVRGVSYNDSQNSCEELLGKLFLQ